MKKLFFLCSALAAAAPAVAQEVLRGEALRGLVSMSAEAALPPEPRAAAESGYETIEIDPDPERPAFILATDLNGDGYPELLVSKFAGSGPMGSGMLDLYTMEKPGDPRKMEKDPPLRLGSNITPQMPLCY